MDLLNTHPTNRLALCWILALALGHSSGWAESRQMAAIAAASDGRIESLMAMAPEQEPDLYETVFEGADSQLQRRYEQTWHYHEIHTRTDPSERHGVFRQLGGIRMAGVPTPYEHEMRTVFAESVARMRLDAALRSAVRATQKSGSPAAKATGGLESVQRNLDKLKNTAVSISESPDAPKIQMGYNLSTDTSKLELVAKRWGLGVYHARLVGALSGAHVPLEAVAMRFSAHLGQGLPQASVSYLPHVEALEGALSQWVTRRVFARVSTLVPTSQLSGYLHHRHRVSLSYSF